MAGVSSLRLWGDDFASCLYGVGVCLLLLLVFGGSLFVCKDYQSRLVFISLSSCSLFISSDVFNKSPHQVFS